MSNFFDLTFGQFLKVGPKNFDTGRHAISDVFVMKTPLWTSMSRFRDKLLYNCLNQTFRPTHMITLTVDENHYDEMCKARSLSQGVRKFWNNIKSNARRKEVGIKYAWRIERGDKKTKRLHIHALYEGSEIMLPFIKKNWSYCNWERLEKDARDNGRTGPIAKITDSAQIISYCLKYASKKYKERISERNKESWLSSNHMVKYSYTSESPVNTKRDLKVSRLVGTTRDIKMMPKWFWLKFNPEVQIWEPKVKDNWVWNRGQPKQTEFFIRIKIEGFYGVPMTQSNRFTGYLQNHFPDFMKQLQTSKDKKDWSDRFNFMVNSMNYDNLPVDKSSYQFLWNSIPSSSNMPVLDICVPG